MKKALCGFYAMILCGVLVLLRAQSVSPLRDRLVGTWRLISSSQKLADGTTRPDPQTGQKGVGYLIYTEGGQVCVVVGNPDRPRWASVQAPTDADLRKAFDGLVAYCGTFQVNESEGCIIHHIEVDRVPNLAGTDRKRFCSFSGNRLVLSPAPPLPAGVKEWTIVWERIGK